MQTDPNWSNFLYDEATRSINLIDFGAARSYPKPFVDNYLRMVSSSLLVLPFIIAVFILRLQGSKGFREKLIKLISK